MSDIVTLTKQDALRAFIAGDASFKRGLKSLLGGQINFDKTWKDIKTFNDACEVTGDDPHSPPFKEGTRDDLAYKMLKVIVRAINGVDWVVDWNNSNQRKYYIMWEWSGGGFRLSFVDDIYSYSYVGSRFYFESREGALHAAEYFTPIFNQYLS